MTEKKIEVEEIHAQRIVLGKEGGPKITLQVDDIAAGILLENGKGAIGIVSGPEFQVIGVYRDQSSPMMDITLAVDQDKTVVEAVDEDGVSHSLFDCECDSQEEAAEPVPDVQLVPSIHLEITFANIPTEIEDRIDEELAAAAKEIVCRYLPGMTDFIKKEDVIEVE